MGRGTALPATSLDFDGWVSPFLTLPRFLPPVRKPRPTGAGIRRSPLKTAHLAKTVVQRAFLGGLEGEKTGLSENFTFFGTPAGDRG